MLRKKLSAIVLVMSIMFAFTPVVEARTNNNDQVVAFAQTQDTVATKLDVVTETTATSTVLVDLSDTTNFKHIRSSGAIEVFKIRVNWSTQVVATTTLKFGVIASSTASGSNVDVYWFDEVSFNSQNLGNGIEQRRTSVLDYSPGLIRLSLLSGQPASFVTNDSSLYTAGYATTSPLLSPKGYSAPGVGDLVMQVYDQKGTATTSVTTLYRVVQ